ncbi:MAG: dehydrogenase/D-glycero-alpha-D-manno-heptose-7-phosphate kinase [Treponematales bacterium]
MCNHNIIRAKAPLRLGLAGGGTDIAAYADLYGGYVLNVTIDLYAYCIIEPNNSGEVRFTAADLGRTEEYPAEPRIAISPALKLHTGIYNRIVADYNNGRPLSLTMTTYCDAPAGSGLGSSSTLAVAIIKAYTEWLNLPLGEYDIAQLAYQVEREDLCLAGGMQDQYAATFGGFNFMEFYRGGKVMVNPLRLKRWIRNELEISLVLFYTGVSRESANIIQEQIGHTEKGDARNVEGMHEMKRQAVLMKEAILKGDFAGFSRSLKKGWEAKKNLAGSISNPLIDELYSYAMANGAESAKISGAGGGGFMMIYCDPRNRIGLINALKKREGRVLTPSFTEIGTQAWTIYNN